MLWYSHCGHEVMPRDTSEVLLRVIIFKPHFPTITLSSVLLLRLKKENPQVYQHLLKTNGLIR